MAIGIKVDQAKTSIASFGLGDGYHENIIEQRGIEETPLDELVKDLVVNYQPNYSKSGQERFEQKITRSVHAQGNVQEINLPFVFSPDTADRIADFRRKRIKSFAKQLSITVGLDAEPPQTAEFGGLPVILGSEELGSDNVVVLKGERVEVLIPTLGLTSGSANADWEVIGADRGVANTGLRLMRYDANTYTYEPLAGLPADPVGIPADLSLTDPDPVTALAVTTGFANDAAFADLTWTLPEDVAVLGRVFVRVNGTQTWQVAGEGVTSFRVDDLTPGLAYDFMVLAVSEFGRTSGAFEPGSIVVNQLMPGDTTPPATPTGLSGSSKFGKLIWTWNESAEADFDFYEIEIYTASTGGTLVETDKIKGARYEIEIQTGDLTSTLTRWAQVRAVDKSGNQSSFTSRVSASTGSILQDDITNNEITNRVSVSNTGTTTTSPIIQATITVRFGSSVLINFTGIMKGSAGLILGIERDGTNIYLDVASGPYGPGPITVTFQDDGASAGSHTYKITAGNIPTDGISNRNLVLTELRR